MTERRFTSLREDELRLSAKKFPGKILFSRKDAALALGTSISNVDELIANFTLRATHLGRRVLIHRDEIERVARNHDAGDFFWHRPPKRK